MHVDKKLMHRVFLLIAGSIVFAWLILDTARASLVFQRIWGLISPFVIGTAIAFIFNVPMRAIERQLSAVENSGVRRTLAILLTIAALVLVIMFVVELLVPQIGATLDTLAEKIPDFVDRTANTLMLFLEENPDLKEWVYETTNMESIDWPTLVRNTVSFLGDRISSWMGGAVNVIGNVTSGIVNTVISIVFAMYCLSRKEILARQGRRVLYAILPEHTTDRIIRIMRLTNSTFSNFISGQALEAVILGCLFAVAMALFKMPYIPLVSVTIAVTALIPVVGAFVGCIVGAFFILVDDPILAVTFVAMFLVLQQMENNLIYPRVVGTSIGLPGMWVLVAVTIGGELMGVGGMLLMIPLTSVLYTLAREFTNKRLAERNIPAEKLMNQPPELKFHFQNNAEHGENLGIRKLLQKLQQTFAKKK